MKTPAVYQDFNIESRDLAYLGKPASEEPWRLEECVKSIRAARGQLAKFRDRALHEESIYHGREFRIVREIRLYEVVE